MISRFARKLNSGSKRANSRLVAIVNVWSHNHNTIWHPLVIFLHITPLQLKSWMVQTTFSKKWIILLKNDLISIIDGIDINLSPTNVTLQRLGNFGKEEHLQCFANFLSQSISNSPTSYKRNMGFLQGHVWTCE